MHDIGKKDFYFSIEEKNSKEGLFFLTVNINGTSFSDYENPIEIYHFMESLDELLNTSTYFIDGLDNDNIEEKLIEIKNLKTIEYLELEKNITAFENSAVRSKNKVFFFYKIPNHPFYEPNLDIKIGAGYADIVPIESVQIAFNELKEYLHLT
ncbi:hypothetical protein [Acinetobacter sp. BSP-28]|uniref:hypothetical protein n=1 Tax=Acinetobacter sp. BSP-28 TaxID=3344661 RepID=UPI00376F46F7